MRVKYYQHHFIGLSILALLLFNGCTHTDGFSFAVTGDPMADGATWVNALTEIRDMNVNPDPQFDQSAFVICVGDIAPVDLRYKEYKEVFKKAPLLIIIGNHEFDDAGGVPGDPKASKGGKSGKGSKGGKGGKASQGGKGGKGGGQKGGKAAAGDPAIIDFAFIRDEVIPATPNVVLRKEKSCSYYYDHKNVRVISVDGYSGEFGFAGIINAEGKEWVEGVIKSTPSSIDHVFVSIHAPAFPRVRHTGDSFNAGPEERNSFWNMLMAHRDKVHGVFVAHTHYYYRMRVADPAGEAANNFEVYPDEKDGIYQVDVGAVGRGPKSTILHVEVDGKNVSFRVLEAENGSDEPFNVIDEWQL